MHLIRHLHSSRSLGRPPVPKPRPGAPRHPLQPASPKPLPQPSASCSPNLRSAAGRNGVRALVWAGRLGSAGVVLMLNGSRLGRISSDWQQLIELCGLSHTLLADESGIYDPRDPNDRFLLGVKGTLSEAELFTLRTRLYEGRWNKARKGLLQFPLPVGYVRASDGAWELDPDQQVRQRLAYLFEAFRRLV